MILSKSYDEIMDKIEVTDEMRERILNNIQTADLPKKSNVIPFSRLSRYLSIAACLALLIVGAVAVPKLFHGNDNQPDDELTATIPDIAECSSASELSDMVGFPVTDIPSLPFTATSTTYTSYWKELAQIEYAGSDETLLYRKSMEDGDNSGDYNEYETVTDATISDISVTLKGNGGLYQLAIWQKDGYSYSISLTSSMTEQELLALVAGID